MNSTPHPYRQTSRFAQHSSQTLLAATVLLAAASSAFAVSPGITSYTWTGSQVIPDNNASGTSFSFSLSPGSPLVITDVTVDLTLAGGWNGDLYAYLSHGSGFSVLLNRVGSTAGNLGGSQVSGMNVEFSDAYLTDIHGATGNPLSGNFAPDARFVSPYGALDTDPRTAFLSSFSGLDPNGTWTLFFADVSPLTISTIQSWSVNIGLAVPEPGSASLFGLAGLLAFIRRIGSKR